MTRARCGWFAVGQVARNTRLHHHRAPRTGLTALLPGSRPSAPSEASCAGGTQMDSPLFLSAARYMPGEGGLARAAGRWLRWKVRRSGTRRCRRAHVPEITSLRVRYSPVAHRKATRGRDAKSMPDDCLPTSDADAAPCPVCSRYSCRCDQADEPWTRLAPWSEALSANA